LRDTPAARAESELLGVTEYPCPSCNQPLSKYSHVNSKGEKKSKLLCAIKPKVKCQKVVFYETSRGYWNPDSNRTLGENLEISSIPCPKCQKPLAQVPKASGGFFLKCQGKCKDLVMFQNHETGEWFLPQNKSAKKSGGSSTRKNRASALKK
jgi:endogenous inhibitor of DNA gyrase (YacG/DUF329 family)